MLGNLIILDRAIKGNMDNKTENVMEECNAVSLLTPNRLCMLGKGESEEEGSGGSEDEDTSEGPEGKGERGGGKGRARKGVAAEKRGYG